jgi:hypothetical protein
VILMGGYNIRIARAPLLCDCSTPEGRPGVAGIKPSELRKIEALRIDEIAAARKSIPALQPVEREACFGIHFRGDVG